MVNSSGVNPKPRFGPILDSTAAARIRLPRLALTPPLNENSHETRKVGSLTAPKACVTL